MTEAREPDLAEQDQAVRSRADSAQTSRDEALRDQAFAELFRAHYPRVQAYLWRRTLEPELARDLSSEVFRLAWEASLRTAVPTAPWLFVTARNLLANANRAAARSAKLRHLVAGELSRDPNLNTAAVSPAEMTDQQEQVRAALDALPGQQREILMAHYWDGLSGAECAALLGCSTAAVWMRLGRARAAFKDRYATLEDQS
jgi:RNA polymerase sigma-70 factor (ECF subfamily)